MYGMIPQYFTALSFNDDAETRSEQKRLLAIQQVLVLRRGGFRFFVYRGVARFLRVYFEVNKIMVGEQERQLLGALKN